MSLEKKFIKRSYFISYFDCKQRYAILVLGEAPDLELLSRFRLRVPKLSRGMPLKCIFTIKHLNFVRFYSKRFSRSPMWDLPKTSPHEGSCSAVPGLRISSLFWNSILKATYHFGSLKFFLVSFKFFMIIC